MISASYPLRVAARISNHVAFKLLDQGANSYHFLPAIGPSPACSLELTEEGRSLSGEQVQGKIDQLITAISTRVAKIHKEQSILHIQPVGKTFLLMDKTSIGRIKAVSPETQSN